MSLSKKLIYFLLTVILGFGLGVFFTYNKYVYPLKSQYLKVSEENGYLREQLYKKDTIKSENKTTIQYIPKKDKDSDVELANKNKISVSYNGKNFELPNKVEENQKFENGKLVIDNQQNTELDISKTVDELVDLKAKQYSRTGKADFGMLYSKENNMYGGIRYNAKAFDVGYYHNFQDNDWIVGFHYKF